MRKISIVVTNRASYGRLYSIIKKIHESSNLELQLIFAGAALTLNCEFSIYKKIYCLIDGDSHEAMVHTTSLLSSQLTQIFSNDRPDIVLIHGDRYEMLAVAITASYMNIPIAHSECGEISGTIDNKVRSSISSLSDIYFPVTCEAKLNIAPYSRNVYVVGSTALDNIKHIRSKLIEKDDYIVLLHHPDTSTHEDIEPLINAVTKFNKKVIWVNPNVDAGYMDILKKLHNLNWEFKKNLSPLEYAELIYNSACCVGNSSSFIKECSFLGVASVVVGSRQKGREFDDNAIFVPMQEQVISIALEQQYKKRFKPSNYFGDGTASTKIANILAEVEI